MDEAKDHADQIIAEARTKAERLEAESRTKAERMESAARMRSEQLDSETAERRAQLFGRLEQERDKLAREIDDLRAFEREYRSRLRTYFEQQLQELQQRGPDSQPAVANAAPAGPPPNRLRALLGEEE